MATNPREAHAAYMREWRKDPVNAQRQAHATQAWRDANPEKSAEYSARYRANHPEQAAAHAAKARTTPHHRENFARRKLRNRRWSWEYRLERGCCDCGLKDPRVLEFDHIDGKSAEVSTMVTDGQALEAIIAEADRCEVRCRNCHFIITLERQNAYSHVWWTQGVPWE
jgi:tRNA A-37 threonylcarbamoyl transferase component Bud32